MKNETELTIPIVRALGRQLAETITAYGISDPRSRVQVLLSLLYAEASGAQMSLRDLAETSIRTWEDTARAIEGALRHDARMKEASK